MRIVVLDGYTLNPGDNPWDPVAALGELTVYDRTPAEQIVQRGGRAEVILTNKTAAGRVRAGPARAIKFHLRPGDRLQRRRPGCRPASRHRGLERPGVRHRQRGRARLRPAAGPVPSRGALRPPGAARASGAAAGSFAFGTRRPGNWPASGWGSSASGGSAAGWPRWPGRSAWKCSSMIPRWTAAGDCPDFCGRRPRKWDCPLRQPARVYLRVAGRRLCPRRRGLAALPVDRRRTRALSTAPCSRR